MKFGILCGSVIVLGLGALLCAPRALAKPPSAKTKAEFQVKKRKALIAAGVEHIEVGKWCRDAGLVPQATAEFLRAQEVSEDQLPWAKRIVDIMRRLGDRFWKHERKKPYQY